MSEKLCLQWNDFKDNASALFENLREDQDFTDVTLACEDGEEVEAHKVILAASSPFFKALLAKHRHPHPLIFMRVVSSENLVAIIDFLYRGEVDVLRDNLDSFFLIAEDLKLKGLTGTTEGTREEVKKEPISLDPCPKNPIYKTVSNLHEKFLPHKPNVAKDGGRIGLLNNSDNYVQELDEKVKSMIEKSGTRMQVGKTNETKRVCICKMCGKQGRWVAIRDHIEAKHLEGVSLACNQCEKTFGSRHNLRMHKSLNHKVLQS